MLIFFDGLGNGEKAPIILPNRAQSNYFSNNCKRIARNLLFHLRRRIHWRAGLGRGKGGLAAIVAQEIGRIDQRDHAVNARDVGKRNAIFILEGEGLRHRHRLRNSGRLDQQRIKAPFFRQLSHFQHQVLAQRAADASVRHLNELFLGLRKRGISAAQGLGIDIHLAHVVDDDRDLEAIAVFQDMVEQGSFAGPKEAGKDGDGEFGGHDWRSCFGRGGTPEAASSHQRKASSGGSQGFPLGRRLSARQQPARQSAPWVRVIHCS